MIDKNNPSFNKNLGWLCSDWQLQQGRGDKNAILWIDKRGEEQSISYRELCALSNRAANALQAQGVRAGQKLMLLLPRSPEFFALFLAALKIGANTCILFTSIGEDALSERICDTNTSWLISEQRMLFRLNRVQTRLKDLRILVIDSDEQDEKAIGIQSPLRLSSDTFTAHAIKAEDPSHFHFTSGTTGKPKGVQHRHACAIDVLSSFREVFQVEENDLYWCTADPGWVTGCSYGILAPLMNGSTMLQSEIPYNAEQWMHILSEKQVKILYTAPTVFRMLATESDTFFAQFSFDQLKRVYCVGEPLSPAMVHWGRRIFQTEIYDTWFQTECGTIQIANRPGLEVKPGWMGKALSTVQASIFDEQDLECPPGQEGRLVLRAPWNALFSEYMQNPQATQAKFSGNHYLSGDLALYDEDGYFRYIGRQDDVINTAGHLVSPYEVEAAILEYPNILECAVVGLPDEILHEKVLAFVRKGATELSPAKMILGIKLHVSNKVAPLASPKEVVFVEEIPKTINGKIARNQLKELYQQLAKKAQESRSSDESRRN